MARRFFLLPFIFLAAFLGADGDAPAAAGHRGQVSLFCADGGACYSAGADGFVNLWDAKNLQASGRFQGSRWNIAFAAPRPRPDASGEPLLALAESGGANRYRVSLWNPSTKDKKFSLTMKDPVTFIGWSGAGTMLFVSTAGTSGLFFIDPANGKLLEAPPMTDKITFAATGKSEKTMVTYSPAGFLSYWDIETKDEIRRFAVSRNLSSPLLFGSRRFFAGIGSEGISVYDAVSGKIIAREKGTTKGFLACADSEGTSFHLFTGNKIVLYFLNAQGKIDALDQAALPSTYTAFLPLGASLDCLLGSKDGSVSSFAKDREPPIAILKTASRIRLTDFAVSGSELAFITDDKKIGVIPSDYQLLKDGAALPFLPNADAYNRITANGSGGFIFWQDASARTAPALWTSKKVDENSISLEKTVSYGNVPFRAQIRSVSSSGGKILFLTSRGGLFSVSADGEILGNWAAQSATDAAFLSDGLILLGQNSLNAPPFSVLNAETGKTAPVEADNAAGLKLFRGPRRLYGAAVGKKENGSFTRVYAFLPSDEGKCSLIAEYGAEETDISLAALDTDKIALNSGSDRAVILGKPPSPLARTSGFVQTIAAAGGFFVASDTEGALAWHDPSNGTLLAEFSLSGGRWFLKKADGAEISGVIE